MGWRNHLQSNKEPEIVVIPWVGGRHIRYQDRRLLIEGSLPDEIGWHKFKLLVRKAIWTEKADSSPELFVSSVRGYLVGDRIVPDGARIDPNPSRIIDSSERVHFLDPGMDRFSRIMAGRTYLNGPLVYGFTDYPIGPEHLVLEAYLDRKESVHDIPCVTPALDAAFRIETIRRREVEERRAELERLRQEEQERLRREELRREISEKLGSGEQRRQLARTDFFSAAFAALQVSGAELLDHRPSTVEDEMVVTYRLDGRRFQCVCDYELRIVDAGICLEDHRTRERGDRRFTLESLPDVVRWAQEEGGLHVTRIVDDYWD